MVKDTEAWGRAKATARYGSAYEGSMKAADQTRPQRLGDDNNLQGPGYDNDVASDWRRGMGPGEAEGKPGFCNTPSGKNRGA